MTPTPTLDLPGECDYTTGTSGLFIVNHYTTLKGFNNMKTYLRKNTTRPGSQPVVIDGTQALWVPTHGGGRLDAAKDAQGITVAVVGVPNGEVVAQQAMAMILPKI